MIQFNEMHSGGDKKGNTLFYRVVRILLMIISGIMMFYYMLGVVNYLTSGPSITLLDDLTTEFVVQVVLLGLSLFYLIVAWFRHISYGIISLVFICIYSAYSSLLLESVTIGFVPISVASVATGFILLGIIKKHSEKKNFDLYAEPIIDEYEGPDIFNFRI